MCTKIRVHYVTFIGRAYNCLYHYLWSDTSKLGKVRGIYCFASFVIYALLLETIIFCYTFFAILNIFTKHYIQDKKILLILPLH